ncbi:MAG: hypothetical protein HQ445_02065 [Polaromonas sp.]|nr:hypothetical protein [Polaromonas sp.]
MPSNTAADTAAKNVPKTAYIVQLVDSSDLSADQRAAAELRFRMALEFALGGPAYVLPSLQAYMLAQTLNEPSEDDEADDATDTETDDEDGGMQQMITLWEKAESDAIQAALKPLGKEMAEARFEIVPVQT